MEVDIFYRLRVDQTDEQIKSLKKRISRYSWIRTLLFVIGSALVYAAWSCSVCAFLIGLFTIALFVYTVRLQVDARSDLDFSKRLKSRLEKELDYRAGGWKSAAKGEEFLEGSHPFAGDLNVFGIYSLFQYLNRSETKEASQRLARNLANPSTDQEFILQRRLECEQLAAQPDFIFRYLTSCSLSEIDANDLDQLAKWVQGSKKNSRSKISSVIRVLGPLVALPALGLYFSGFISLGAFIWFLMIPALMAFVGRQFHKSAFNELAQVSPILMQLETLVSEILAGRFQNTGSTKGQNPAALRHLAGGLKQFRAIVGTVDSRNNFLVSLVLNLFIQWDFWTINRLMKWRYNWADELMPGVNYCIDLEALMSLAVYTFNHPHYTYAILSEGHEFSIVNGKHVLMGTEAVPNSISLGEGSRLAIVTGANMAGKSTFLRMVGTNLLLSMLGLKVPVDHLEFKPVQLFTSMVNTDSLGKHESYFFSELQRLKMLIDGLHTGKSYFVILDEILKGTNSVDKARGSRLFLEKVMGLPVKGIIATHDLSICQLAEEYPGVFENYRFEVEFQGDELFFPFKLENGVCQNMNASILLKKLGITD